MDNLLRRIELTEDIVIYKENQYRPEEKQLYIKKFQEYVQKGVIKSSYENNLWIGTSGIKQTELDFNFREYRYKTHTGKLLVFTVPELIEILKCYAISIFGVYIWRTIALRLKTIREFLTSFGNQEYRIKDTEEICLIEFLGFIGLTETEIDRILAQIPVVATAPAQQRKLQHMINYLALDNELTDLYKEELPETEFIKWFPLYFWCKVSFILPMRATETLVTPFDCIQCRNDDIFLRIRRTMLKKGARKVFYDIEQDYRIFEYKIPEIDCIKQIEKYQKLTGNHQRRFLFDYSDLSINKILSLPQFNMLITEFFQEYLIGNHKYDYSRFATGIKEFTPVTAGDSRPIAMSNLYYQDNSADICRQLADHMHLTTSEGYYTNVSNTVLATSIMDLQRKINQGYQQMEKQENRYKKAMSQLQTTSVCSSLHQPLVTGDISDCVAEDHLEECLGCRYYTPGENELKEALNTRRKRLDDASKMVLECISDNFRKDLDYEKIFLEAHTGITRYQTASREKAQEEFVKWQRRKK